MKNNVLVITFILVFLTKTSFLQAQESLSFTLSEAQEYAIKNNTTVVNASIDIEKAEKKIWETTAIGLPQVSAKGAYQHLFTIPEMNFSVPILVNPVGTPGYGPEMIHMEYLANPIKLGVPNTTTFDVTVSQLIFNGSYIVGLQAAKVFRSFSEQNYNKSVIDIRESVANSYFLVLVAQENKTILDSSLTTLKKTYYEMSKMLEEGFIENTDLDQIQLTVNTVENALEAITQQLDIAKRLLKYQMGIDFEKEIILTENVDNLISVAEVQSLIDKAYDVSGSISYQMLETQEKIQELNLAREKSDFLPTISAFYNHQEKTNKAYFDFSMPDILGVNLSVPIFSSGMRLAKVKQASLELEKTRNLKEMATNGLILEAKQAQITLFTSYNSYLNSKKSMELAKKIYDKTLLKYKEGISSSMELSQAYSQYLTAEANYYTALMTMMNAKSKLIKLNSKN